jgi:hypothetical protein
LIGNTGTVFDILRKPSYVGIVFQYKMTTFWVISTRGKPKRKESPAEQSHLAWKATSLQSRGFFATRIVIHMDGGVTALMLASLL